MLNTFWCTKYTISERVHTDGVHLRRLHSLAIVSKNTGLALVRSFAHSIAAATASASPSASDGRRTAHFLPPAWRKRLPLILPLALASARANPSLILWFH